MRLNRCFCEKKSYAIACDFSFVLDDFAMGFCAVVAALWLFAMVANYG